MLIDASVARSAAVLGWIEQLAQAVGGSLAIAHGVIGIDTDEPSELRRIRDALEREINTSPHGSGRYSKAVAAVHGLDTLLHLGPPTITLLIPGSDEVRMAARLTSRQADDREWRRGLGLRARRLDTGEAVSISIAHARGIDFASDDGQALVAYTALTTRPAIRTRDVIKLLVNAGMIDEATGREGYRFLQEDDLPPRRPRLVDDLRLVPPRGIASRPDGAGVDAALNHIFTFLHWRRSPTQPARCLRSW